VNDATHSEICAVPAERLAVEQPLLAGLPSLRLELGARPVSRRVDKLSWVRFGSARYSVPCRLIGQHVTITSTTKMIMIIEPVTGEILAEHRLVAPGETSIVDEHYGRARPDRPRRAPRPRTQVEKDFLALGEAAEAFLVGAAAAGVQAWHRACRSAATEGGARPGAAAVGVAPGCGIPPSASRRCPIDPGGQRRSAEPAISRSGTGVNPAYGADSAAVGIQDQQTRRGMSNDDRHHTTAASR